MTLKRLITFVVLLAAMQASAVITAQQFDEHSYSDVMLMCASTAKAVHHVATMRDTDIPAAVTLRLLRDEPYFRLPLFQGAAEEAIEYVYGVGAQLSPNDVSYFYYKGCTAEAREHFGK